MTKTEQHVVLDLVGKHTDLGDHVEVGTILIGIYPTEAEANAVRDRRNALGRNHACITMTAAEYGSLFH